MADAPTDAVQEPTLLPRGAGALPKAVVAEAHRQRLLTAVGQAVAEKGYVATSIADIVGRARVSRSAFYALFADKEECFLAAYQLGADRHFELIASAATHPDWLDELRLGVCAYVRELERAPGFARSFLIEILAAGPRAIELRNRVHERYAALMKEWYSRAPAELELPELPEEIFRAAVGANNELVIARLERLGSDGPAQPPLEELVLHSLFGLFGLRGVARARSPRR